MVALGAVLGLVGLLAIALGIPHVGWLTAGFLAPIGYAGGVLAASWLIGRGLSRRSRVLLPFVVMTMHLAWGTGFLRSVPRSQRRAAGPHS